MGEKGWGSATGQYSLNLIKGRGMISILENEEFDERCVSTAGG